MKFAIDRIESNIAILENLETKKRVEVSIDLLPENSKDGTILIYKNNNYIIDESSEIERRKSIMNKFNKLKKK